MLGLRAISIFLVLAGHANPGAQDSLPFGVVIDYPNLGVRVFFVISGFLITSLLLKERARTGGISLRLFYIRRALRILPPREMAPVRSRLLKQGPCWSPIQPWAFEKASLRTALLM